MDEKEKEIIVSGASDDLIEIDGAISEEFGVKMGSDKVNLSVFADGAPAGTVVPVYDGAWSFMYVGVVDEEDDFRVTMPSGWRLEVRASNGRKGDVSSHSMSLHFFVPSGCAVSFKMEE